MADYKVKIVARQEGLEYTEGGRVRKFDVIFDKSGEWTLYTDLCSDVKFQGIYERRVVIPRIVKFLETHDLDKGLRYKVKIVEETNRR